MPSCFEQHFSAANQSIGPTKNALPTKYNPIPVHITSSPDLSKPVLVRIHSPLRRQNVNDKPAPIRANVFIVFFICLMCERGLIPSDSTIVPWRCMMVTE